MTIKLVPFGGEARIISTYIDGKRKYWVVSGHVEQRELHDTSEAAAEAWNAGALPTYNPMITAAQEKSE